MTTSVVTGAARGIGRAFVLELARPGATVVLADIDLEAAERTAEEARRQGARAVVVRSDVTRPMDLEAIAARWSSADLVIANAGILVVGEAHDTDVSAFRRAVDINLFGVVHTCQAFAPRMMARGGGALLNVASLAGLVPAPLMGCYAATKAAVIAYSDALRAELSPHGVTVTALCPSFTRTELIARGEGRDPNARAMGQRLIDGMGARPDRVARVGLDAARRGQPYAVPTLHARLARRLRGIAPDGATHVASAAYRVYRHISE